MKIKFRVWDKQDKKMIRSPYDADFNVVIVLPNLVEMHKKSKTKMKEFIQGDYLNERFEVMLHTGIEDKNNKEIYEGDIIKTRFGTGEVIYKDCRFLVNDCLLQLNHCIPFNIEILGNIYENKELKKKYVDRITKEES